VNYFALTGITKQVGLIQVDPGNWVLNQVGTIIVNMDETIASTDFSVVPNPASHSVTLVFADEGAVMREISILDLSGSVIKTVKTDQQQYPLTIAELPAGTYICQVLSGKNQYFRKFVKMD
jgi:hypothetical protein